MITSKQRAALRGCANSIDTILQIGKGGIGDTLVKQVDDALTAREVAEILVEKTACEPVQVIGNKIVLFRRNPKKPCYDTYLK